MTGHTLSIWKIRKWSLLTLCTLGCISVYIKGLLLFYVCGHLCSTFKKVSESLHSCWSVFRRKNDAMGPHNLYTLITERLGQHSSPITLETYNILFAVSKNRCMLEKCSHSNNSCCLIETVCIFYMEQACCWYSSTVNLLVKTHSFTLKPIAVDVSVLHCRSC